MNKWMTLQIIVEGLTEQNFVNDLLVDYLAQHNIAVHASQLSIRIAKRIGIGKKT